MECSRCKIRSSVGYCVECRALLCERCGLVCDGCGKPACPVHLHETPHGRRLCDTCIAKRNAQFESVIAEMQKYSREVMPAGDDETGYLYGRLNAVLDQIRGWDKALRQAYDSIEERVATRTRELQAEIAERQRTERELQRAKQAAEAANRAKSDFLANVSHEIRTPLNGIIAMAELLLHTTLRPDQRRYAEAIRKSGAALMTILGDILDYSKIEAGCLTIEPIPFDLEVAIGDVIELLSARAEEKGLSLMMRYAPNAPRRIIADAGRLRQVLMNLVGNAIKFTHKGHVLVNTDCLGLTDRQALLRISVEDTGIGIPKEKLATIFRKFAQADASTAREYGGTGLGLAITRQLVKLMGGRIGVKSETNVGSRFRVTLMVGLDRQATSVLPDPDIDLTGARALVVDAYPVSRHILSEQIIACGMHTIAAASNDEALSVLDRAAAEGQPIQIVLVSHRPPEIDGAQLGMAVKSKQPDTILVLITATGERGDALRIADLGYAAYLSGPLRQSQFHEALTRVWSAHRRGEKTALVTRHTIAESRDLFRRSRTTPEPFVLAHVLLAEDNPINQEVAVEILQRLGCRVDVAWNGEEAVAKSRSAPYDLILMDCQMPKMDGYAAARAIREQEAPGRRVPIIALTAHAVPGDRERCLAAGMDDYVTKPVTLDGVASALSRWRRCEPDHPLRQEAPVPVEVADLTQLPVLDKEQALSVAGGKARILNRVTGSFLMNVPREVAQLKESIEQRNRDETVRLAHSISGAASVVGGSRVHHIAFLIEQAARQGDLEHAQALFHSFEEEFTLLCQAMQAVEWVEAAL